MLPDQGSFLSANPFNAELKAKFNESGPYYSSFPPLARWQDGNFSKAYTDALRGFLTENPNAPLYFYVHIPFCAKLCWYCICNIQITNNRDRMQRFLDVLLDEIRLLRNFFHENDFTPNIREIHLGGGTPSHLDQRQVSDLVAAIFEIADPNNVDEFAMEIDPRTIRIEDLEHYAQLGVDRISFGVQDFDRHVQEKINRIQPYEMIEELLSAEVVKNFQGVNFDLLYGLPMQTRETFRRTIEQTLRLSPDRVTLIKYAHVPEVRRHMSMIKESDLPDASELPNMFSEAVKGLTDGGYTWVGIDNFAKPTDDLAIAATNGTVGRNFGGSSPGRADNIIGVGPTVTCSFGNHYFQSTYDPKSYAQAVSDGVFPIAKGFELNADELARRDVIFSIQCTQAVDYQSLSGRHNIDFQDYFVKELADLEKFTDENIVEITTDGFRLTTLGRYFVPHVCRVFDDGLKTTEPYRIHGP